MDVGSAVIASPFKLEEVAFLQDCISLHAILQKSDFNPTELFSSPQKDWETLAFPQVVTGPKKPQDCKILISLKNKEETVLDPTCFHFSFFAKTFGKKMESHKGTNLLFLTYRLPIHTVFTITCIYGHLRWPFFSPFGYGRVLELFRMTNDWE